MGDRRHRDRRQPAFRPPGEVARRPPGSALRFVGARAGEHDVDSGSVDTRPRASCGPAAGRPETVAEQLDHVAAAGLEVLSVVAATTRDWDEYQSRIWHATLRWTDEHTDDPRAAPLLAEVAATRGDYLRTARLGGAVLVLRRPTR